MNLDLTVPQAQKKSGYEKREPVAHATIVTGVAHKFVKALIWTNIYFLILKKYRHPIKALRKAKSLVHLRNVYRDGNGIRKYVRVAGRYFFNYNAPGWPSKAFNRYINHQLNRLENSNRYTGIHTLILGITNKCGYKCEHCFEWKNLNRPESLTQDQLCSIVTKFQQAGVSQIQLSGGEPLNRLDAVFFLLKSTTRKIDFWLYTSGYHLTYEKAKALKKARLTGVAISLDHWDETKHDQFRGKQGAFKWAVQGALNAAQNGLAVCFSLCATKQFITEENLAQYANLAKQLGVGFIQILEPRAIGHYEGRNVSLDPHQIALLERFYQKMNFETAFKNYPAVTYHGFYSRRIGCSGSAGDYLYVDMDGDAHACPFCQHKKFNVLTSDLRAELFKMKNSGCSVFQ